MFGNVLVQRHERAKIFKVLVIGTLNFSVTRMSMRDLEYYREPGCSHHVSVITVVHLLDQGEFVGSNGISNLDQLCKNPRAMHGCID